MSGRTAIDPELVPSKVNAIDKAVSILEKDYKSILNTNQTVKNNWQSAAATSVTNAIDQNSEILNNLIKLLRGVSNQLTQIAKSYREADDASTVR